MISRAISEGDRTLLDSSLSKDTYHKDTKADFFYAPGTFCNVHEDDTGPVMFVRATKSLRFDVQFVENDDRVKNAKALKEVFQGYEDRARANGFTEFVFFSDSPALKKFCEEQFGFKELNGEMRKLL